MGEFKTKVLLTQKNSVWGIIKHPNRENEFPHILSWENEEIKEEFINRELFSDLRAIDPNFNFKDLMRSDDFPHKPRAISTASKATFKMDHLDNQFSVNGVLIEQDKQTILNKDFAIILEIDPQGNETWTYWAVSVSQSTPKVYNIEADLDVFFTYSIKEMFNDNLVQIKRAHYRRFTDDGTPNIFNTINSYPEDFDAQFSDIQLYDRTLWTAPEYDYIQIQPRSHEYKASFLTYRESPFGGQSLNLALTETTINFNTEDRNLTLLDYPFCIVRCEMLDDLGKWYRSFIYDEFTVSGIFKTPFILPRLIPFLIHNVINVKQFSFLGEEINVLSNQDHDVPILLNRTIDYGTSEDTNWYELIDLVEKMDINLISDINGNYDWRLIGKIYSNPYFSLIIEDFQNSTYNIPYNKFIDNKFVFKIEGWLTENMVETYLSVENEGFNDKNTTFGIGGSYNSIGQKSVNPENAYLAYHKAELDNSIKVAERHKRQAEAQGAMGIISSVAGTVASGLMNPLSLIGGVANMGSQIAGSASQIENAGEELDRILAKQEDLKNAPNQVSNGNTSFYKINASKNIYSNLFTSTRNFFEIKRMKPVSIVLEKLAWYFHLAGVDFASTPHNINDFLTSNYYFNYIKLGQSVFSNFKMDLSSEIKQLIDSVLQNGTTIWHIRDLDQFKGVANYYVNNVEMELL